MQYTTSSFQCVLITDGSSSYAVFIYDCGGMEWSGATIGWAASSYNYATYVASGSNSESIGCLYSSTYSAIVYRLDGRRKYVLVFPIHCHCVQPLLCAHNFNM